MTSRPAGLVGRPQHEPAGARGRRRAARQRGAHVGLAEQAERELARRRGTSRVSSAWRSRDGVGAARQRASVRRAVASARRSCSCGEGGAQLVVVEQLGEDRPTAARPGSSRNARLDDAAAGVAPATRRRRSASRSTSASGSAATRCTSSWISRASPRYGRLSSSSLRSCLDLSLLRRVFRNAPLLHVPSGGSATPSVRGGVADPPIGRRKRRPPDAGAQRPLRWCGRRTGRAS